MRQLRNPDGVLRNMVDPISALFLRATTFVCVNNWLECLIVQEGFQSLFVRGALSSAIRFLRGQAVMLLLDAGIMLFLGVA